MNPVAAFRITLRPILWLCLQAAACASVLILLFAVFSAA
jgi:hypothetical protein